MQTHHERRVLPNGLRVIGVENGALHSFVCAVDVHAGPRFEPAGQEGLTHFLEHLLMQGCAKFPSSNAIMRAVEDLGGVIEASTTPEYLNVTLAVHKKHWRRGLEIISDVILHPVFDEKELEQEKRIVAQELARVRDRRGRNISAPELAYSLLLKEHVAESGMRGSVDVLNGFKRAVVESHYCRFFLPENTVICLAGGFDFEEVCEDIGGYFGEWQGGGRLPELVPPQSGPRRARAFYRPTENLPVVDSVLCYRAYALGDEHFHAAAALSNILGGGLSSRLFTHVREEKGLVYHIHSYPQAYSDTGSVNISLNVDGNNLVEALAATLEEVERLGRDGVRRDELERYKETVRCGMEIMCDRPERLAEWFGKQELLLPAGKIMTPQCYVEKQESLTLDRLRDAAQELFDVSGAALAVVGPFQPQHTEKLRALFPAQEASVQEQ